MRFEDETNELIDCLSKHIGSTRTGAVRYAIRETIRALGLEKKGVTNEEEKNPNKDLSIVE